MALAGCSSAGDTADSEQTPAGSPAPTVEGTASPNSEPGQSATSSPGGGAPSAQASGRSDGLQVAGPTSAPATLPPVEIGKPAVNDAGVEVLVVTTRDATLPAGAPGEIGGPGVAFDVTVVNKSDAPVDMTNVVADARSGPDLTPALRADRNPTVPFSGVLAPGASAKATYVFKITGEEKSDVTLLLNLNASTPTVVFHGSVL